MNNEARLIRILEESFEKQHAKRGLLTAQHTAQDLHENGVILPPCKVGQTVYYAEPHHFDYAFCGTLLSYSLDAAHLWFNCYYDNGLNMWHSIEDFGKTVFLTKEEAEAKLKEREGK